MIFLILSFHVCFLSGHNSFCRDHSHFNDKLLPKKKRRKKKKDLAVFSLKTMHMRELSILPNSFYQDHFVAWYSGPHSIHPDFSFLLISLKHWRKKWNSVLWRNASRWHFQQERAVTYCHSVLYWRGEAWMGWQLNLSSALPTLTACILQSTCWTCRKNLLIKQKSSNAYWLFYW